MNPPETTTIRVWRPAAWLIFGVVIGLIGLAVGLYPAVSSWLNEVNQTQAAQSYLQETQYTEEQEEHLERAHRYNQALNMGVDLLSGERIPTSTGEAGDTDLVYQEILSSTPSKIMARLRIDSIGVDLPVYHGTDDETLLRGAGHLEGSSLPVGGPRTHSVITAHRGLPQARMFDRLPELEIGETFTLVVFGEVLTYQITETQVVEPEDTESLRVNSDDDLVTLVTCTPLGVNSHRILVTGQRIVPTPAAEIEKANEPSDVPGFPWWIFVATAGIGTLGVLLWRLGYTTVTITSDKSDESA